MKNVELKLKERMKDYYYGQMNLLKGNFNFVFHFGDFFSIKNYYLGQGKVGICTSQSEVYKRENDNLGLIRVKGSEPTYFNSRRAQHFYLLHPTKNLPEEFWSFSDKKRNNFLKKSNSLIVDPSFKRVFPFKSSGYVLDNSFKDSIFPDSWLASNGSSVFPLGIMKEGDLVSLSTYHDQISFFFKRKFGLANYLALPLGSRDLDLKLKNEQFLEPIAKILNKKYLEYLNLEYPTSKN